MRDMSKRAWSGSSHHSQNTSIQSYNFFIYALEPSFSFSLFSFVFLHFITPQKTPHQYKIHTFFLFLIVCPPTKLFRAGFVLSYIQSLSSMATAQQTSDCITPTASPAALNILSLDTKEKHGEPDKVNERRFPNPPTASVSVFHPRDVADQLGQLQIVDHKTVHPTNAYHPQAQLIYPGGKRGTYPLQDDAESLGNGSAVSIDLCSPPSILLIQSYACLFFFGSLHPCAPPMQGINQNPSMLLHGYGFVSQMCDAPYAPSSVQLPSVRGHGDLYSTQQFPTSDLPYCQQPVSPSVPFVASPPLVPQAKVPLNFDQRGKVDHFQQRSVCSPSGSSVRESTQFRNTGGLSLMQQGFEALGFDVWSDLSKPLNGQNSLVQMSSSAASLKPIELQGLPENNLRMFGGYPCYNGGRSYGDVSTYDPGFHHQIWPVHTEARQGGRLRDRLCSCTGKLETFTAQNKGPRASKPKSLKAENGSTVNKSKNAMSADINVKSYNQVDFPTNYQDAKFFVIKSYSEDNVFKSIKYGVWASTPSGNKKLDAAYREAKEQQRDCPIFLLFSVNASAQFCGVAEMVGPVDFDKSVDYWQQDKWTGHFPLKWHMIKDIPNSQFRHIIVKDNDNKPVTNSRDTQEVELEQGIDMLNIFKNYEAHSSILDDFDFYEERHKALQEKKVSQQTNPVFASGIGVNLLQHPTSLSNCSVNKMSQEFC
ncbi:YTH domain-containing protein ECT4 isoform X1 [Ziziphus jujuba]|uniref:YTH domain-containing family protein n=2 Tax=Ziziphus jujuba TaxID=326968 RepID=A0A6P6GJQ5_ZIZJJ|nr:YTH domain-containing protein ECT4 isoform X1 [Ziziphus jujuba]